MIAKTAPAAPQRTHRRESNVGEDIRSRLPDQQPGCSEAAGLLGGLARKARFWALYVCYLLLLVELGSHAYWGIFRKTSVFRPDVWGLYFTEWGRSGVEGATEANRDGEFRVLLLGGSVMSPEFGSVEPKLQDELATRLGRKVRIYNLAYSARTSRDSLLKYRALEGKHFDLVVFYHGINDTHMNCCPTSMYRNDYTHCRWYSEIDLYQKLGSTRWIMSPFTLCFAAGTAADVMPVRSSIGRLNPDDAWMKYGADVKTRQAFHDNLAEIVERARGRQEPVLVMSFAYHLPQVAGGTRAAEKAEDYASGTSLVQVWGLPENVAHGIDVHNEVIRETVRRNPGMLFVDQHALMPRDREHFHDCCHLTEKGCSAFVQHIASCAGEHFR
jgi:hypothetical protein